MPVWNDDAPYVGAGVQSSFGTALKTANATGVKTRLRKSRSSPAVLGDQVLLTNIDSSLGYSEDFMQAPTIPLGKGKLPALNAGGASTASQVALPSMFAAELTGPGELTEQPWEWVFHHLWRKGSGATPLRMSLADTVILSPSSELLSWFFTDKRGIVKKKNSNKLVPQAIRNHFEREALAGAFNVNRFVAAVHRSGGGGAALLDETAVRDLTKESGDWSGLLGLQLYIHAKGGNGSRYVCEYVKDRVSRLITATVHKLVYMGADGVSCNRSGADVPADKLPKAHMLPSYGKLLNDDLIAMTKGLCMRLELHSKQTLLHMNAQFILDENEKPWFVGGAEIITLPQAAFAPPRAPTEKHVPVNPTLQLHGDVCMGDYCKFSELREASTKPQGALRRSKSTSGMDALSYTNAILLRGDSLGEMVVQSDGSVRSMAEVVAQTSKAKSSMLPAIELGGEGEGASDGDDALGGGWHRGRAGRPW